MSIQVAYPEYRYEFIKGNCDYTKEEVPDEKVIEFEGKRVLLIHGHTSRERGLIRRAITENFDVVLYGHTHVAKVFNHQDKIFLNPGCVSMPKVKNKRSYAILNIENGEIDYRFIPIL